MPPKSSEAFIIDDQLAKQCSECGEIKILENFSILMTGFLARASKCKICAAKIKTENRTYENNKSAALKKLYKINLEDYNRMYEEQHGLCNICGDYREVLQVDHCHNTDIIRGLLCNRCNFMLGNAKDNIEILEAAIRYLKDVK